MSFSLKVSLALKSVDIKAARTSAVRCFEGKTLLEPRRRALSSPDTVFTPHAQATDLSISRGGRISRNLQLE
ncbi:hypothetical protein AOLI_G00271670 [Acnodon oligacanthus]